MLPAESECKGEITHNRNVFKETFSTSTSDPDIGIEGNTSNSNLLVSVNIVKESIVGSGGSSSSSSSSSSNLWVDGDGEVELCAKVELTSKLIKEF